MSEVTNETTGKERKETVPEKQFLQVYLKGCAEGKTRKQIASALGMKESSFRTREQGVRDKWQPKLEANGKKWPTPKSEQGRGGEGRISGVDELQKMLDEAGL